MSSTISTQDFCLHFVVFGLLAYIHSNRQAFFISEHVRQLLQVQEVAVSKTALYNPQGSAHMIERYGGLFYKQLTIGVSLEHWEQVISETQYVIRTLQ